MNCNRALASALLAASLCLTPAVSRPAARSVVRVNPPDLELVDQNGKKGRFLTDFLGDRATAVTFTYTTCTTICPVLDGIFQKLQDKIAHRLGRDLGLVTLSIDPVTDIPPRLKAHAVKLRARPGWTFLTGSRENMTKVLKSIDMYAVDILNHPPTVFIVDPKKGQWIRLNGFPSSKQIQELLEELRPGGSGTVARP
ncbi:MAG: SCO family protein [Deltaproteobacteria bacterium]|nr:SCO family protein [Deltaproteobacteria bacterium]